MPKCKECDKEKLEMDMNNRDLCKLCWVKKENVKYNKAGRESWKTRRKNRELKLNA